MLIYQGYRTDGATGRLRNQQRDLDADGVEEAINEDVEFRTIIRRLEAGGHGDEAVVEEEEAGEHSVAVLEVGDLLAAGAFVLDVVLLDQLGLGGKSGDSDLIDERLGVANVELLVELFDDDAERARLRERMDRLDLAGGLVGDLDRLCRHQDTKVLYDDACPDGIICKDRELGRL